MNDRLSPTTHLLYLHGFRSSPRSMKATQVAARVQAKHSEVTWWCPQLPPSPQEATNMILRATADWPEKGVAVVGSSLGGFYARWFALQRNSRAALLNPAVHPARDLARYIGEQTTWQNPEERFYFQPAYIAQLQRIEDDIERLGKLPSHNPPPLWALIAQGDEVLDWREMQAFCAGGDIRLLEGGDHAISDFDQHIDALFDFLHLSPA